MGKSDIIDFWVLHDNEPIISRTYGKESKSKDQMIGLLSALKSFSSDFYNTDFEGIVLKGYKFFFFESPFTKSIGISFCAGTNPKINVKNMNKLFKRIEKEYINHSKNNQIFVNHESIKVIVEKLDKIVGIEGRD